jgi:hypothetical protein
MNVVVANFLSKNLFFVLFCVDLPENEMKLFVVGLVN